MAEARRQPRVRKTSRVYVTVLSSPERPDLEGQTYSCSSLDISVGGVRLIIPGDPPLGSSMKVRYVSRAPVKTFRHTGEVCWLKPTDTPGSYEVGIKFAEASPADVEAWQQIIETFLSRQVNPDA